MVVALGLLAGVVLSMAGLVVVGNRWVVGGRHASEATALSADAIEEVEGWGFEDTWQELGCTGSDASCDVNPAHGTLADWRTRAAERLPAGDLTMRIDAVDAARLDAAPGLRVTVVVTWTEGTRAREMRLVRVRS